MWRERTLIPLSVALVFCLACAVVKTERTSSEYFALLLLWLNVAVLSGLLGIEWCERKLIRAQTEAIVVMVDDMKKHVAVLIREKEQQQEEEEKK